VDAAQIGIQRPWRRDCVAWSYTVHLPAIPLQRRTVIHHYLVESGVGGEIGMHGLSVVVVQIARVRLHKLLVSRQAGIFVVLVVVLCPTIDLGRGYVAASFPTQGTARAGG
jgi:hypothetical protein